LSEASLHALPHAISFAHRADAKLIVLHVIPAAPTPEALTRYNVSNVISMRENARIACLRQLEHLIPAGELEPLETEFIVWVGIPSEKILQLALDRGVDLIILGVCRSPLSGAISHVPYGTAYEIACGAGCPVLTIRQ
jgi:nucleotide-binding universal stress UspA family protein